MRRVLGRPDKTESPCPSPSPTKAKPKPKPHPRRPDKAIVPAVLTEVNGHLTTVIAGRAICWRREARQGEPTRWRLVT